MLRKYVGTTPTGEGEQGVPFWGEAPQAGAPDCYSGWCWFESSRPRTLTRRRRMEAEMIWSITGWTLFISFAGLCGWAMWVD